MLGEKLNAPADALFLKLAAPLKGLDVVDSTEKLGTSPRHSGLSKLSS